MEKFKGAAQAAIAATRMVNEKSSECVKVVVRCRPLSGGERSDNRVQVVFMDRERAMASLQKPGGGQKDCKEFTYDGVYCFCFHLFSRWFFFRFSFARALPSFFFALNDALSPL